MTKPETTEAPAKAENQPLPQVPVDPVQQALNDLAQNVSLIEKALAAKEERYIIRALRSTSSLRSKITPEIILSSASRFFPKGHAGLTLLKKNLPQADSMEVDETASEGEKQQAVTTPPSPEVEIYYGLLTLVHLVDQKHSEAALSLALSLIDKAIAFNRRTLDQLLGRIYYYYGHCSEACGQFENIRGPLLNYLRTATLHHDEESQATLLNLLLRNYIHYNLLDQADKLISKSTFPASVGNNQFARFHYFLGRIKAIQLDYTESHKHLLQAIRKAPQLPKAAGFQQSVYKFSIIVQLLLGEIPSRAIFRQPVLKKSLIPYLHITQAVRIGDLPAFHKAMQAYGEQFRNDKTYTLILRLRHNVIKTGIRMISLSYSRISLKDICHKLHLESEEDAEFIISKAIRDGVIDASIDHAGKYMKSKEILDLYSTSEPQESFHQRIGFCLNLHNEAVKALRFPPNVHKREIETPEERLEREQQEKELAKELEEDDDLFD